MLSWELGKHVTCLGQCTLASLQVIFRFGPLDPASGPVTENFVPPPTIGTERRAVSKFSTRRARNADSSDAGSNPSESRNTPACLRFPKQIAELAFPPSPNSTMKTAPLASTLARR
jgi:hypothetical protein